MFDYLKTIVQLLPYYVPPVVIANLINMVIDYFIDLFVYYYCLFICNDTKFMTARSSILEVQGLIKVEKILKGSLDSIPSPSPSVKIQIMGRKVCLMCKDNTLLGVVHKLLKTKSLLTSPSNVLLYYLK